MENLFLEIFRKSKKKLTIFFIFLQNIVFSEVFF